MLLDYPSSQALWILFADQRPKLGLGLLFVLPVLYLFADVLTLPVLLNMSWNKVCKDLHVLRLVLPVTTTASKLKLESCHSYGKALFCVRVKIFSSDYKSIM